MPWKNQNTHDDTEKKRCHMWRSVVPRSVAYTSMQAEGASVFFTGAAQWLVSPAGRRDTWGPLQSLSGDRLVTLLGPLPRRAARAAGKKTWRGTASGGGRRERRGH